MRMRSSCFGQSVLNEPPIRELSIRRERADKCVSMIRDIVVDAGKRVDATKFLPCIAMYVTRLACETFRSRC